MPQVGIDPPAQSHASYEASTLPPSHHGWIREIFIEGECALPLVRLSIKKFFCFEKKNRKVMFSKTTYHKAD